MTDSGVQPRALNEMSIEELWELFPIVLCEHRREYAQWYSQQRDRLVELLGPSAIRISHIGSTAVRGLLAKPTVDILLELPPDADLSAVVATLTSDGWAVMNQETGPQWSVALNKGYTPVGFAERVYHLHVRPVGDPSELYFRDYLREHPRVAKEYANLKRKLQARYEHDRDGYTDAKGDFVARVTDLARSAYPGRYARSRPDEPQP